MAELHDITDSTFEGEVQGQLVGARKKADFEELIDRLHTDG
jgi:hypothetical protein